MGTNNVIRDYTPEELSKIEEFKKDLQEAKEDFVRVTSDRFGCTLYLVYIGKSDKNVPEVILENIKSIDKEILTIIGEPSIPREIKVSGIMSDLILQCGVFYTDDSDDVIRIFPSISRNKIGDWDIIDESNALGLFRFQYIEESNAIYVKSNVEDIKITNIPEINDCLMALKTYTRRVARLVQKLCNNIFREELKYVYESTYSTSL